MVQLSASRLDMQTALANQLGYFYIVNDLTGLVLQAHDSTLSRNGYSLREQIEQRRVQQSNASLKIKSSNSNIGAAGQLRNSTNADKSTPPQLLQLDSTSSSATQSSTSPPSKGLRFYLMPKKHNTTNGNNNSAQQRNEVDDQLWYYYLINGCIANKSVRSGYCMAASSLNAKSPVCFWPNVKTTNCSWFYNAGEQTITSGLSDDLVLDVDMASREADDAQCFSVIIDKKVANKASQKWSFEFM